MVNLDVKLSKWTVSLHKNFQSTDQSQSIFRVRIDSDDDLSKWTVTGESVGPLQSKAADIRSKVADAKTADVGVKVVDFFNHRLLLD